ncbi:hypothetical protein DFP93_10532 [Aneurinibacillus soli]|uniref:Uncharacterized protein n=1 Tax=Aneurinibacillus soli TaxID=1500254 RepID=A0A0U5BCQ9_9BACL|nr:hypothetical protein [Aneurinibacillus soli]PYE62080.1 hypothetical protein DFP93_10532 [Aneurinibacillus soli]BAU28732.1 hypothetical protein CB4_02907 [Aneurinibacillus soli]
MEEQKVDHHLQQAFAHLREALNVSIAIVLNNHTSKEQIGKKWEVFFGEFFGMVKTKGKEHKLNLLSWISFPKIWRW